MGGGVCGRVERRGACGTVRGGQTDERRVWITGSPAQSWSVVRCELVHWALLPVVSGGNPHPPPAPPAFPRRAAANTFSFPRCADARVRTGARAHPRAGGRSRVQSRKCPWTLASARPRRWEVLGRPVAVARRGVRSSSRRRPAARGVLQQPLTATTTGAPGRRHGVGGCCACVAGERVCAAHWTLPQEEEGGRWGCGRWRLYICGCGRVRPAPALQTPSAPPCVCARATASVLTPAGRTPDRERPLPTPSPATHPLLFCALSFPPPLRGGDDHTLPVLSAPPAGASPSPPPPSVAALGGVWRGLVRLPSRQSIVAGARYGSTAVSGALGHRLPRVSPVLCAHGRAVRRCWCCGRRGGKGKGRGVGVVGVPRVGGGDHASCFGCLGCPAASAPSPPLQRGSDS